MRMKKLMILAAVAAIAATACTRTFEVEPTQHDSPIGFNTWANTLTKAHDPGNTTNFAIGDDFNVYGTKLMPGEPAATSQDVFNGTRVEKTVDAPSETWTYSPLRFWDPSATSYTFYAVAPAGLLDGTGASATTAGAFRSEPIEFLGGDSQKTDIKDILVAAKTTVTTFNSPVHLAFYHIASLVDLQVQKVNELELVGENATNYIKVAVSSISLTNIDGNGHFTISSYGDSAPYAPETDTDTWTEETSASKKTYNNTSGYETAILPADVNAINAGAPNALITKLVAMPQTFRTAETDHSSDQTVNISYSIEVCEGGNSTTTNYSASFDLKEFDNAQDLNNTPSNYIQSWLPGKHYTYIITIGANAISFTASIQDWTTDTGYHYLIN